MSPCFCVLQALVYVRRNWIVISPPEINSPLYQAGSLRFICRLEVMTAAIFSANNGPSHTSWLTHPLRANTHIRSISMLGFRLYPMIYRRRSTSDSWVCCWGIFSFFFLKLKKIIHAKIWPSWLWLFDSSCCSALLLTWHIYSRVTVGDCVKTLLFCWFWRSRACGKTNKEPLLLLL